MYLITLGRLAMILYAVIVVVVVVVVVVEV